MKQRDKLLKVLTVFEKQVLREFAEDEFGPTKPLTQESLFHLLDKLGKSEVKDEILNIPEDQDLGTEGSEDDARKYMNWVFKQSKVPLIVTGFKHTGNSYLVWLKKTMVEARQPVPNKPNMNLQALAQRHFELQDQVKELSDRLEVLQSERDVVYEEIFAQVSQLKGKSIKLGNILMMIEETIETIPARTTYKYKQILKAIEDAYEIERAFLTRVYRRFRTTTSADTIRSSDLIITKEAIEKLEKLTGQKVELKEVKNRLNEGIVDFIKKSGGKFLQFIKKYVSAFSQQVDKVEAMARQVNLLQESIEGFNPRAVYTEEALLHFLTSNGFDSAAEEIQSFAPTEEYLDEGDLINRLNQIFSTHKVPFLVTKLAFVNHDDWMDYKVRLSARKTKLGEAEGPEDNYDKASHEERQKLLGKHKKHASRPANQLPDAAKDHLHGRKHKDPWKVTKPEYHSYGDRKDN